MYLDPGFGSMIIQMIIASLAVVGAVFFMMKERIKKFFVRKKRVDKQQEKNSDGCQE